LVVYLYTSWGDVEPNREFGGGVFDEIEQLGVVFRKFVLDEKLVQVLAQKRDDVFLLGTE
jgi:hypothetical protein